jgi:hypothetical protein
MPTTLSKSSRANKKLANQSNTVSITNPQQKTRFLLILLGLGGDSASIKKSELNQRLVRKDEKSSDYKELFEQLEQDGAIALSKASVSLTPKGLEALTQGLIHPDFAFEAQIGAKNANGLLKVMRQIGSMSSSHEMHGNGAAASTTEIKSYEGFKPVVLEVYDRLNRDYNLDDLVPIYRIRREIGDQVTRSQFNEWMLEMQANEMLQLIGGEMPSLTPDKAEDSIRTELGGERYYAKRL